MISRSMRRRPAVSRATVLSWLRDEHRTAALAQFRESIAEHELRTLLVSRRSRWWC